jgi:Pirin
MCDCVLMATAANYFVHDTTDTYKSVQWLNAGSGVMHEEMWNIEKKWQKNNIEIYQLWVRHFLQAYYARQSVL